MSPGRGALACMLYVTCSCTASHECTVEIDEGTFAADVTPPLDEDLRGPACAELQGVDGARSLSVLTQTPFVHDGWERRATILLEVPVTADDGPWTCPGRSFDDGVHFLRLSPPAEGEPAETSGPAEVVIETLQIVAGQPHATGTARWTTSLGEMRATFDAPPCTP